MIEVKLNTRNAPKPLTFDSWAKWVYSELTAAGIPVVWDGSVNGGMLERLLDPDDFGGITYRWHTAEECFEPDAAGKQDKRALVKYQ